MILGWFRKKPHEAIVARLHEAMVAQSRLPALYLPPFGAPDTFEGRFEVLTLNAGLVLTRLSSLPEPGPEIAQALADAIFSRFDDALREKGVSDVGVPKKMKKLARAFMGRGGAYSKAMQGGEETLAAALSRNVLAGEEVGEESGKALARYVLEAKAQLDATPIEVFLRGEAPFPQL
jgi:cytochrome b pre-mRNA-processing protein 3